MSIVHPSTYLNYPSKSLFHQNNRFDPNNYLKINIVSLCSIHFIFSTKNKIQFVTVTSQSNTSIFYYKNITKTIQNIFNWICIFSYLFKKTGHNCIETRHTVFYYYTLVMPLKKFCFIFLFFEWVFFLSKFTCFWQCF